MPRPVSSNEPIGLDPSAFHAAVIPHLPPPTSSTPPPTLPSSNSSQLSSPPPANAWWEWDELSGGGVQQQAKDDLNLNMSVEYSLRRQRHALPLSSDFDTDAPAVFGFMDESMKNDGFVPILFDERSLSAATHSASQPSITAPDAMPTTATLSSTSPSSDVLPSSGSTFQTIASVSAPSAGKSSGLLDGESGEFICPCCGVRTAGGMSYHGHVTQCYMSRFLAPSRSQPSSPRADSRRIAAPVPVSPVLLSSSSTTTAPSAASIQSLRECVSQLGLHTRLSMMEAFFRLSRSTATAETTDTPQPFPVEEKLISLLYSPAPHTPSPPLTAASPTSLASASSSSPSYRYSPDIERPFSPSSYSSHEQVEQLYPRTPAQSPPRSPHTPHTCLTPALHQWGVDEEKGEPFATFSLHDTAHHYTAEQQTGNYTSAPSSPSPAVKRARALSQPAIPYFDDLSTPATQYTPNQSLSMTSPTMRSYSPVQVHTHHHYASPSSTTSSAHPLSSPASSLVAPAPLSASRRNSTGNNRSGRQPKSSKGLFQPVPQRSTPSTGGSSYIHTPRGKYDASSVLDQTDDALGSPASAAASAGNDSKGKRRRREANN